MPGGLREWCGLCGTGCAAMREPYSKTHFYTYRLTCISSMTATRMDSTLVCRGGACRPPRSCLEHASSEPKRPATTSARDVRPGEAHWQQAHRAWTLSYQVR